MVLSNDPLRQHIPHKKARVPGAIKIGLLEGRFADPVAETDTKARSGRWYLHLRCARFVEAYVIELVVSSTPTDEDLLVSKGFSGFPVEDANRKRLTQSTTDGAK